MPAVVSMLDLDPSGFRTQVRGLITDLDKLDKGFKKAGIKAEGTEKKIKKTGVQAEKSGKKAQAGGKLFAAMFAGFSAALIVRELTRAGRAVTEFIGGSVALAAQQEAAFRKIDQTLKSTGNTAGLTAQELAAMAQEFQKLTGIGDEVISTYQNMLLTFTSISRDVFPEVIERALDIAETMGTSVREALIQVAKATNDPVLGLGTLSRVGIQFTQGQKDMAKQLVATGDQMGAQRIILDELQKQFGGAAEAARNTLPGAFRALGSSSGDVREEFGKALLPIVRDVVEELIRLADGSKEAAAALGQTLASATSDVVDILQDLLVVSGEVNTAFDALDVDASGLGSRIGAALLGPFAGVIDTTALGIRQLSALVDGIRAEEKAIESNREEHEKWAAAEKVSNDARNAAIRSYGDTEAAVDKYKQSLIDANVAQVDTAKKMAEIEAIQLAAAIQKQAEAWSKLLGEASPGIKILSDMAKVQFENERAADAAAEALKREKEAADALRDSIAEEIKVLIELKRIRDELTSVGPIQPLPFGAGPSGTRDFLLGLEDDPRFRQVGDVIGDAAGNTMTIMTRSMGEEVGSIWAREIEIAGKKVGVTWAGVLSAAISLAQDFGRREQGRFGGNVSGSFAAEGGQAGALLGGILGGALGAQVGQIIGGVFGDAFKQGADEGLASLRQIGQDVAIQITRDEGGLGGVALQIGQAFNDALAGVESILRGQIDIAGFDIKIRDDVISVFINGITGTFETIGEAVDFALVQSLKGATFFGAGAGASPEVLQALQGFAGDSIDQLNQLLALALRQEAGRVGPEAAAVQNTVRGIMDDLFAAIEAGIDPSGSLANLARTRDAILGIQQDLGAVKAAEIEAFNAELLIREAGLFALLAELEARGQATQGFAEIAAAQIGAENARIEAMGAATIATVQMASSAANATASILAALSAIQGLRIDDAAAQRAIAAARRAGRRAGRAGRGGGARAVDPTEDLLLQLDRARLGTDEMALAVFEFGLQMAALQERMESSNLTLEQRAELLALEQAAFAELARQAILDPFQAALEDTSIAGRFAEIVRLTDEAVTGIGLGVQALGDLPLILEGSAAMVAQLAAEVSQNLDSAIGGVVNTIRQALPFITSAQDRVALEEALIQFERQQFELSVIKHELEIRSLLVELELLGELDDARRAMIEGWLDSIGILTANMDDILDGIGEGVAQSFGTGGGVSGVPAIIDDGLRAAQALLDTLLRLESPAAQALNPIAAANAALAEQTAAVLENAAGLAALGFSTDELIARFAALRDIEIDQVLGGQVDQLSDIFGSLLAGPLSGLSDVAQFQAQQGLIMDLIAQAQSGDAETRFLAQQQLINLLPGFLQNAQSALGLGFGQFQQQFAALLAGIPGITNPFDVGGLLGGGLGGPTTGLPGPTLGIDTFGTPFPTTLGGPAAGTDTFVNPITSRLDRIEAAILGSELSRGNQVQTLHAETTTNNRTRDRVQIEAAEDLARRRPSDAAARFRG